MDQFNLWSKAYYLAPYPCVANTHIIEYDMEKANINVLLYYKAIDQKLYDMLYSMDKLSREIYIGKMEARNPEFTRIKADGIKEFRCRFIEQNNIQNKDILAIKNDAIYVIGDHEVTTAFDNVVFRRANDYTAFMKIGGLEVYYAYDPISDHEVLDIKGIREEKLELHREYMVSHICDVLYMLQCCSIEEAIKTNSELLEHFLNRRLDKGYYREFNAESKYRFNAGFNSFVIDYINDDEVKYIDLSVNVNVLRNISGCLSTLYFSHK